MTMRIHVDYDPADVVAELRTRGLIDIAKAVAIRYNVTVQEMVSTRKDLGSCRARQELVHAA